jgi:hypothetical protein
VVRMGDQIMVETKKWKRLLHRCCLQPGHAVDLGTVWLRQDAAVATRVVGIRAKGQREPWWLAPNREDSLSFLASLYDRRMAIEEQIRDTKGARFGLLIGLSPLRACNPSSVYLADTARCNRSIVTVSSLGIFRRARG